MALGIFLSIIHSIGRIRIGAVADKVATIPILPPTKAKIKRVIPTTIATEPFKTICNNNLKFNFLQALKRALTLIDIKIPVHKILQFVGLGLAAALCQAVGVLLLKPIFQTGDGDPILVSTLRIGVATLALISIRVSARFKAWRKLNFRLLLQIVLNGSVAMVVGMTLLIFALVGGNIGIVATLSATAPILILPMLWIIDKKIPNATAWVGAVFAVMGCFFIFN